MCNALLYGEHKQARALLGFVLFQNGMNLSCSFGACQQPAQPQPGSSPVLPVAVVASFPP